MAGFSLLLHLTAETFLKYFFFVPDTDIILIFSTGEINEITDSANFKPIYITVWILFHYHIFPEAKRCTFADM